ncbi:hypothetical protein [Maridesulfovibrio sp.]|uniref:hypothetical protein n=1 Tax=Maridesulfovibrio sp. TaxID=2795000 RepID=UPI002A18A213|nr:hypothetical protein [Maridesulfovibrio sp.]
MSPLFLSRLNPVEKFIYIYTGVEPEMYFPLAMGLFFLVVTVGIVSSFIRYQRIPLDKNVKNAQGKIFCPQCSSQVYYNRSYNADLLICRSCGKYVARRDTREIIGFNYRR